MSVKTLGIVAAIAASMTATGAMAQSVTPEQVLKLPIGTKYAGPAGYNDVLTRTAAGFRYTSGDYVVECNNVTKAGGRGNATINCTAQNKVEVRFEWINMSSIKLEGWRNMAAKAGQTQHKPAQLAITLTRK